MKRYKEVTDDLGKVLHIETCLRGKALLNSRELNKGTAFSKEEREAFSLLGKLPDTVTSMECQEQRYLEQYQEIDSNLQKNIFLNELKQHNETLFYHLASQHLKEMLPIVYTPTIGDAVQQYSHQFNLPQGLYFTYPEQDNFDKVLAERDLEEIDLIIVTDGEGVLGIGDWGVGGMDILIGKLMVYTLCGGINPRRVLPIQFDVGTNNKDLLEDKEYVGWRHERVTGEEYDQFIDKAVAAIRHHFPKIFLHWEDFGRDNARKNLNRYRDKMATFNDDMQGTGATALATLLSGLVALKQELKDQRIVFFGAGTAGCGIADQMYNAMLHFGMPEQEARDCFWLIDREGLLKKDMANLAFFQEPYARSDTEAGNLLEVIHEVKPTVLIGCSTVKGAFNEEVVKAMASYVEHPLIFPLSNPTSHCEADPQDLYNWTDGKVITAAGSPFPPVKYNGKEIPISQCNNAYVFPGIGLGIIASQANRVTDGMIAAAANALSLCSPARKDKDATVLPDLDDIQQVGRKIAIAVAEQARKEGVATVGENVSLNDRVEALFWNPTYLPYKLI